MILSSHGIIGSQIVQATGLLIEYPGAAAAYSLRLLRSTYTGSAIGVRIDTTGQPEYNIGFVDGELDVATLEGYCTGGLNAYVKTWYDQSGNGRDASQTTAANQPQIVSSGTVILDNGKPCIEFNGTSNRLTALNPTDWNFLHQAGFYANFGVAKTGNSLDPGTFMPIWGNTITAAQNGSYFSYDDRVTTGNNASRHIVFNGQNISNQVVNNFIDNYITPNVQFLHSIFGNPNNATITDRSKFAVNGGVLVQNGTSTGNTNTNNAQRALSFGSAPDLSNNFLFYLQGTLQEQIFYASDQSTNRTGIETNINNFYSIY